MRTVLGIDPALNHVGYGILFFNEITQKIEDIKYGIYDINPKDSVENKLDTIFENTRKLLQTYNVTDVAMEKVYHNPKMAKGGFLVSEAIGAIKVAIVQENKTICYYTPQKIKKEITGNGKASKLLVAKTISELLNIPYFKVCKKIRGKEQVLKLTSDELIQHEFDHISDAISIAFVRVLELKNRRR